MESYSLVSNSFAGYIETISQPPASTTTATAMPDFRTCRFGVATLWPVVVVVVAESVGWRQRSAAKWWNSDARVRLCNDLLYVSGTPWRPSIWFCRPKLDAAAAVGWFAAALSVVVVGVVGLVASSGWGLPLPSYMLTGWAELCWKQGRICGGKRLHLKDEFMEKN